MATEAPVSTDPREAQLRRLEQELAEAREAFRRRRARAQAELDEQAADLQAKQREIDGLHAAARTDRVRARRLYKRFQRRIEAEQAALAKRREADQELVDRRADQHAAALDQFAADQERFAADAAEHRRRLEEAWGQLAENQRRLLADREQATAWTVAQTAELDRRAAELQEREQSNDSRWGVLESRAASLVAEIAGLEARALNTRAVLRQLDERRAQAEAAATPAGVALKAVIGDEKFDAASDAWAARLREAEHQLQRDRQRLAAQQADLDRQATDLADQRVILVEQVAALVAARGLWQSSESATVAEMESLAEELRKRELAAEERQRELLAADRRRWEREQELWGFRAKLERWQAALSTHEESLANHRRAVEAGLLAKRDHLARWEASLEDIARAWSELREREKRHLADELARCGEARSLYPARLAELDQLRETLLGELERLAPHMMAMEQSEGGDRRVRVLRKRWETVFGQVRKELDARRVALSVESLEAADRTRELLAATADLTERMTEATAVRRDRDRTALKIFHANDPTDWTPSESVESETELAVLDLRREADDLAADVLAFPVAQTVRRAA